MRNATMKKTVLITGASRGIGKSIAKLFALNNYNVIINYFKSDMLAKKLVEELKEINEATIAIKADISNKSEVDKMFEQIRGSFHCVDVLINNAGIANQMLFTDMTAEQWDQIFDVNVKGMFHCTQDVAKDMICRKKGKIINISSIWGLCGASCEVAYSASKAAVIGFTKALAKELGPSNIQVNCIAPGIIETDMNNSLDADTIESLINQTPLGKIGSVEDIAHTALFLASEQANFITGQIISPNGGFVI
jgi:3-oxoacyl-[acyl-carrier protein] reductase